MPVTRAAFVTAMVLPWLVIATAAGAPDAARKPAEDERLTLVGCLQAAPQGKGFILSDVQPSNAGTADSALTSAGAGTSATGSAPSGTVTGQTPTGSTATATSAPTPATGEPGASANPASPAYNQGDVTAGTTGTVPRPETDKASPIHAYQVVAGAGVDLQRHAGHTVEVQGSLKPTTAAPPDGSAAREGRGSATAEATPGMRESVIEATRVRHVAAGCK